MAKQKAISLKKVAAEFDKVIKQLQGAAKKKTSAGAKKKLQSDLKYVQKCRSAVVAKCRNSFSLVPPATPPSN